MPARAAGVVVVRCCSPTGVSWKTTGGEKTGQVGVLAHAGVRWLSEPTQQNNLSTAPSHSFALPPGRTPGLMQVFCSCLHMRVFRSCVLFTSALGAHAAENEVRMG